jgi:hypothetical protein
VDQPPEALEDAAVVQVGQLVQHGETVASGSHHDAGQRFFLSEGIQTIELADFVKRINCNA